jgi:hypothetical protein
MNESWFILREVIMPGRRGARKTVHRNSVSGKFVKKGYAKRHPRTTETERVRRGKR